MEVQVSAYTSLRFTFYIVHSFVTYEIAIILLKWTNFFEANTDHAKCLSESEAKAGQERHYTWLVIYS